MSPTSGGWPHGWVSGLVVFFVGLGSPQAGPERYDLRWRPTAGTETVYRSTVTMLGVADKSPTLASSRARERILSVTTDGTVRLSRESFDTIIESDQGQTRLDDRNRMTFTRRANGEITELQRDRPLVNEGMIAAIYPIVPAGPVAIGDTWTATPTVTRAQSGSKPPANAAPSALRFTYRAIRLETIQDIESVVVGLQLPANPKAKIERLDGLSWISRRDGSVMKLRISFYDSSDAQAKTPSMVMEVTREPRKGK